MSQTTNILINIDVKNLKEATAFYTTAFDLKPGRRFGEKAIELVGLAANIYLLEKPEGSSPTTETKEHRHYARHWTPVHLDFIVPDIKAALARAKNAGARIEGDIKSNSWGKIVYCSDPYGNGFCLLQFLGRGYDEIAN